MTTKKTTFGLIAVMAAMGGLSMQRTASADVRAMPTVVKKPSTVVHPMPTVVKKPPLVVKKPLLGTALVLLRGNWEYDPEFAEPSAQRVQDLCIVSGYARWRKKEPPSDGGGNCGGLFPAGCVSAGLGAMEARLRAQYEGQENVAQLPSSCRPAKRVVFFVSGKRLDIHPDGRVVFDRRVASSSSLINSDWMSFTGLAFSVR
jgi:hypothetical protein